MKKISKGTSIIFGPAANALGLDFFSLQQAFFSLLRLCSAAVNINA